MTSKLQSTKKSRIRPKSDVAKEIKEMVYAFKEIPISEAFINRMIEDLKKWPDDNPEEKFLTKFYLGKGLSRDSYDNLLSRHPELKETHKMTMQLLGERLLSKAIDKKTDWPATRWCIHNYSQDFRDNNSYHAALSNQEHENKGPAIVVIEKAVETSVVKKKDKE